jgi:hypothetical protein
MSTWHVYEKVDETVSNDVEDKVDDGYYHGFYIYKTNKYGKDEYIISQSVISPETYVRGIFGSLERAKAAVIRYNKSGLVGKALMLNLKILNTDPERGDVVIEPKVNLGFRTHTGQTIDSIDMYLSEDVYKKLSTAERTIYNSGKTEDVI